MDSRIRPCGDFARIAGAEKVAAGRKVADKWRKSLSGKIDS